MSALAEFALIARLVAQLGPVDEAEGVALGVGDDATVLSGGPWPVLCVDTLVEGVHWDPALSSVEDVGFKLLAVNLSDLAAMAAEPGPFLLALALARPFDVSFVDGLARGLDAARRAHGLDAGRVTAVGGDTTATSGPAVLSLTLLGRPVRPGRLVRRGGALPGDGLWVSGPLGSAAAGLALLQAGHGGPAWSELTLRHRRPRARLDLVPLLATTPGIHAAIDLSDGLAGDLGHVVTASGLGARIDVEALPTSPAFERAVARLGLDRLDLVLGGGEDYELLVAADSTADDALREAGFACVGCLRAAEGIALRDRDGNEVALTVRGYEHG